MKKKVKARDLREAKKQEKIAVYSAAAKAAVGDKSAVEAKPVRPVEAAHEDKAVGNKKSVNKAAGLKSTLVYDDKLYMTSFGRGNSAIVEQRIDTLDYSVSDMNASPSLRVSEAGKINVSFSSLRQFVNAGQLSAVNPLYGGKDKPQKKTGQDMLGLKDKLEERYFGMTFNDNIHIQIIHNILDIEKILAVYTTNIATALDHMVDEEIDAERDEFIGYMNTLNTYEVFMNPEKKFGSGDKRVKNITESRDKFEKLLATKRMGYFGFDYDSNGKDKHKNEELKKRLYHLVAFAGQLRQWSFHGDTGINPNSWLYRLDDKKLDQEYRDTLDYYFDIRFDEINEKFVEQNATNLCILRELFPSDDFKTVADLYYDFIVIKAQKNIGFSLKKLREKMLESEEAAPVKAQDMDSVRSKLYKLMDFCIFKYYTEQPEISDKNVDILRASVSDEQKEITGKLTLTSENEGDYKALRPELRLLRRARDLNKESERLILAENLPHILLTSAYTVSNPNMFNGFQRKFDGAWNIGVVVQMPIWNWFEGKYKLRAARAATTIADLELQEAEEKISLQLQQNRYQLTEANKRLTSAIHNLDSADENLRCATVGFKEGVIEISDVMAAQAAWQQAQSQKIDAEIDVRLSFIALQKALGTFAY